MALPTRAERAGYQGHRVVRIHGPRGAKTFVHETLLRRPAAMVKGMQQTLERIKQSVESQ
jgi:hypothetical protein